MKFMFLVLLSLYFVNIDDSLARKGKRGGRVRSGVRDGSITASERSKIHGRREDVKAARSEAREDGDVSRNERRSIRKEQRQLHNTIDRKSKNDHSYESYGNGEYTDEERSDARKRRKKHRENTEEGESDYNEVNAYERDEDSDRKPRRRRRRDRDKSEDDTDVESPEF